MTIKLGVVMDPMASIKPHKDSTLAMLLEAQARGWQLYYMEQKDLSMRGARTYASMSELVVRDDAIDWFELGAPCNHDLSSLDVILMRKDPPFDIEYINTTYLLEQAERDGVLVVNRPRSLRDVNEKLAIAGFPQCTTPTLITRSIHELREFYAEHGEVILKPLGEMGGSSIFRVSRGDVNFSVIVETLTGRGDRFIVAQRYIAEISAGDKRILMIDGEPVPYALARIPAAGEARGNLAAGGRAEGVALSERDRWICAQVGPMLRERGLLFVGLDVIGDYLTEINVTSPTCIRELDARYGLNISALLMDKIAQQLGRRHQ
ncbi:MAG: glutathione synthase [Gammaproteobacteria bacterium]|nr:glutathione synthase [Gammaproteobacteria bacterium]